MDGLTFVKDARDTDPDRSRHRYARFRQGWLEAVGGETYGEAAPEELKRDYLGYRMGKPFGQTPDEPIERQ